MGAFASKDDFMSAIKSIIGENNSDEAIAFIENASDTYDELSKTPEPADSTDWQKKYEENDAEWRKKYTERFFSGQSSQQTPDPTQVEPQQPAQITIDDLFTERS